jgi:hypothetical protein
VAKLGISLPIGPRASSNRKRQPRRYDSTPSLDGDDEPLKPSDIDDGDAGDDIKVTVGGEDVDYVPSGHLVGEDEHGVGYEGARDRGDDDRSSICMYLSYFLLKHWLIHKTLQPKKWSIRTTRSSLFYILGQHAEILPGNLTFRLRVVPFAVQVRTRASENGNLRHLLLSERGGVSIDRPTAPRTSRPMGDRKLTSTMSSPWRMPWATAHPTRQVVKTSVWMAIHQSRDGSHPTSSCHRLCEIQTKCLGRPAFPPCPTAFLLPRVVTPLINTFPLLSTSPVSPAWTSPLSTSTRFKRQ